MPTCVALMTSYNNEIFYHIDAFTPDWLYMLLEGCIMSLHNHMCICMVAHATDL